MTMKYNGLLALCLAIMLLPAAVSCEAQTGGGATSGSAQAGTAKSPVAATWNEAVGWDLFQGGIEDAEARVFQSPDFQKYLLVPSGTFDAMVLGLKAKDVALVKRSQLALTSDAATIAGAVPTAAGSFARAGSDITFMSAGGAWKLAPEPPLIGEISKADLLGKKKDYLALARAYKPKNAAVSLIKNVRQPIEIIVFFGTWCSSCKHYLPGFMKTIEMAANPSITVRYIGISEDMSEPEALLTANAVTKTPTFIARSAGQELGRIVEKPKGSIEEDLALLLLGVR